MLNSLLITHVLVSLHFGTQPNRAQTSSEEGATCEGSRRALCSLRFDYPNGLRCETSSAKAARPVHPYA